MLLSGTNPTSDVEDSEMCTNAASHFVLSRELEYFIKGEADIGNFARKDKDSEELIEELNTFWKPELCGLLEPSSTDEDEFEPLNIQHCGQR